MTPPRVLAVDDEPNVLAALTRALRQDFALTTSSSGEEALGIIANSPPFAVILSDMRMPGMNGIEFLQASRELSPRSSRIMLTGETDRSVSIDAVNSGSILQFVNKPCSPAVLRTALDTAVEHYGQVIAQYELLEQTLRGAVEAMANVLAIVNPAASGRGMRLKRLASAIAARLGIADRWMLEVAAMLSQIGYVTVPDATLAKYTRGERLTEDEERMVAEHAGVGGDLLGNVPRLESVAAVIRFQQVPYSEPLTFPPDVDGAWATVGVRILNAAVDFDLLEARRVTAADAIARMRALEDAYEPRVIEALEWVIAGNLRDFEIQEVPLAQLISGMITTEQLVSDEDVVLLGSGQLLTPHALTRLRNWPTVRPDRSMKVLVPRAPDEGMAKAESA